MKDNGTGGDAMAGDGIFSATIPGQAANTLVAFYISATDSNSAASRFPAIRAGDNEPVRECAVMFGDGNPGGSFSTYHLWVTQTNVTRWGNLSDLSNEFMDCTFVNGNRVIYNMEGRFAGSPYHQGFDYPNGNLCHYKWEFNEDDKFLGATSISTRFTSPATALVMTPAFNENNWPTRFCARWACRGSTAAMSRCMSTATGAAR